ncbi:glutathione S-transferase-like [Diospyros lotus]|uniref:glutathione S-transferase-like n=1 Tax=Diospyros lotus TaxID=55363 RepID=UPI00225B6EBC|nr:glutathione S-transferase-like [Diospyros lotus]
MATIKLHAFVMSAPAQRVFATLYEKDLPFELIPVDIRSGENKKQPYLSLNPFGQIPALEDGDLKLFESRAITRYLSHAYADRGTQLIFEDSKKMAVMASWVEAEAHQFDPAALKLAWELVFKPMFGQQTDHAAVEEIEAKLENVLEIYEARLAESKYLGGDSFSLADLHHCPLIQYLMGSPAKRLFESRPRVSAWCADILDRPAWLKVVALKTSH